MSRPKSRAARRRSQRTAGGEPGPARSAAAGRFAGKRPVLRFVVVFAVCMGVFYGFRLLPWFTDHVWIPYLRINAVLSAKILALFGEQVTASSIKVYSDRFRLEIAQGCDAIEPSALFAAAVIAFPAPTKRKAIGLAVGVSILFVLNLVRIVSLYYTGVFWPDAFETMHIDVWQPIFILVAMLLWLVWALWATRRPRADAEAA